MLIKDILTIDLSEDIKNVIDLEDISELSIQSEIENYIITDGLAKEYVDFASIFTSTIVETGVWISGFYGSGKSYFGKLLGYLMSNRLINGTPARDRILQRFTGIDDEALIKNSILKLNSINARVVFMDIAKQDTKQGFAYALFRNFLKSLEMPENEHGFLLYSLMCDGEYTNVADLIQDKLGISWGDIKNNRTIYIGKIKETFIRSGNTDDDYNNILTTIRGEMNSFSASRLKDELSNYFKTVKDEKVVFLFDEASEAINQKKFSLLDLEGLSEALSAISGKVWTIAIAQEKLDEVINNSNISKAQLTKVTDRFKNKIHLEATEVDVIIQNRLLKKKEVAIGKLKEYYQNNSGKIADHSGLAGASKTETVESFVTYYPFYQNQFVLLQNFLFGRMGYASTKVAARGMIITTYDILKQEIQNEKLFNVAAGWQISKEAQTQPPVRLVNRYENAENILKNNRFDISGRHLLETIHLLTEAEITPTTVSNIVKSFIKSPEEYHTTYELIVNALDILVEHKILLLSNNIYRITSDIEQRLLDEMNQFSIQVYKKKQTVISTYKNATFIKALSKINDSNTNYDFYITSDNDDELTNPNLKELKLKVKSLYNISDERLNDIEQLRTQYQNDKNLIWVVPDNRYFKEIDKLLEEVERIKYLEEKYTNPNSEEGKIVRNFQSERSVKEERIKELINNSLIEGNSIYLYNTSQLSETNWQNEINSIQRQAIQNVYSQRLSAQLSDTVAERVIKEGNNQRLHTHFTGAGSDFQFFDAHGNLVGSTLKPAEHILYKIRNTFVDGATIEKDLEQPPTGFSFGTVMTTIAALMRGGKIIAKYNGSEKFSWRDDGVANIFSNSREFRKSSFKAIAKSLSSAQRNSIVTTLQELEYTTHIGKKIDWNTNDFDLVKGVAELAKRFCDKVDDMKRSNKDFDSLFGNLEYSKDQLGSFTGAVSEANYIDKAEKFLSQTEVYNNAISDIGKAEKFIRNNLDKVRNWKIFADGVTDELNKATRPDATIALLNATFHSLYKGEVVANFKQLGDTIQKIKDAYYQLMVTAATDMATRYTQLKADAESLIAEINTLPEGLNNEAIGKARTVLQYANQRTTSSVNIDYEVKDKHTRFTYSEMLSFIQLYNSYNTDIEIIKSGLIRVAPPRPEPAPTDTPATSSSATKPAAVPAHKTYSSTLPGKKMKVGEYKVWLQSEMHKISGAAADDEIEITN